MEEKMGKEKKYKKGGIIIGIDELMQIILAEGKYVYLGDKLIHPHFAINFSLKYIAHCLRNRKFFEAELNKKEKNG